MPRGDGRLMLDSRPAFVDRMKGPKHKGMKKKWDTDVAMGEEGEGAGHHSRHSGRGKKFGGPRHKGKQRRWNEQQGHGGPRPNEFGGSRHGGKQGRPKHEIGPAWHKVIVYDGAKWDRDQLLTQFANALSAKSIRLQPLAYIVNEPNASFHVENRPVAYAISQLEFETLKFRVTHCTIPPTAPITPEWEERLSAELKSRVSQTGHLNLSDFANTCSLAVENFMPLYRAQVYEAVSRASKDWLSLVTSVDASSNRLPNTEGLKFLVQGTNIRSLMLSDNRISDLTRLENLKSMKLIEINLSNNPCSDKIKDREKYEQEVKQLFPTLQMLDNRPIDTQIINFDVESASFPAPRKSWYCNESAQAVVRTFAAEYVRLYDTSRDDLRNAYGDLSVFTLSCTQVKDNLSAISSSISSSNPFARLSDYIGESRNGLNQHKGKRKTPHVHVGRDEIITVLRKLPKSKHVDYVIDMPVALEAFIVFTLNGIYLEPTAKDTPRQFTRTFTLVPCNSGFVIVNEMLFVTNPTQQQIKSLTSANPDSGFGLEMKREAALPSALVTANESDEKLRVFMERTRMNRDWAKKCLEENAWDFDRASAVFQDCSTRGVIPPEAFQPVA